jgi:hypothetical protein
MSSRDGLGSPWLSLRAIGCDVATLRAGRSLRRTLKAYVRYYNEVRIHRSLHKDAPETRPVQFIGLILSRPVLGGLHHQYVRV